LNEQLEPLLLVLFLYYGCAIMALARDFSDPAMIWLFGL